MTADIFSTISLLSWMLGSLSNLTVLTVGAAYVNHKVNVAEHRGDHVRMENIVQPTKLIRTILVMYKDDMTESDNTTTKYRINSILLLSTFTF